MLVWQFELARLVPLLLVFGYAALMDHRHGEVTNKIWLYAPVGFGLMIIQCLIYSVSLLPLALLTSCLTVAFSIGLFYFSRGMCGGADCKALIVLALSFPIGPSFSMFLFAYPIMVFSLAALCVGFKFVLNRGKGGLKASVRFLPYFFSGMLITVLI